MIVTTTDLMFPFMTPGVLRNNGMLYKKKKTSKTHTANRFPILYMFVIRAGECMVNYVHFLVSLFEKYVHSSINTVCL